MDKRYDIAIIGSGIAGMSAALNAKIRKNAQRHVYDQCKITDAETGFIFDHCRNTADPRRSKLILRNKQLIV